MSTNRQSNATYPIDRPGSASETVIEAIADAEGVDPTAISPPLYEVLDPDALDSFVGATSDSLATDMRIGFQYYGYEVRIHRDRLVLTEP